MGREDKGSTNSLRDEFLDNYCAPINYVLKKRYLKYINNYNLNFAIYTAENLSTLIYAIVKKIPLAY